MFHDGPKILEDRRPAEFLLRLFAIGHELGGIDDFLHGKVHVTAQIEDVSIAIIGQQMLLNEQVGAAQAPDVDVIPNAGATRRWVAVTINSEVVLAPTGGLQNQRDQVALGVIMVLS